MFAPAGLARNWALKQGGGLQGQPLWQESVRCTAACTWFFKIKKWKNLNLGLIFEIRILLKMLGRNVLFSWSFSLSPPDWFSSFNNGNQCLINLNQSKASPISIQSSKEYNWSNIYNHHKSIIEFSLCSQICTAWKLRLE